MIHSRLYCLFAATLTGVVSFSALIMMIQPITAQVSQVDTDKTDITLPVAIKKNHKKPPTLRIEKIPEKIKATNTAVVKIEDMALECDSHYVGVFFFEDKYLCYLDLKMPIAVSPPIMSIHMDTDGMIPVETSDLLATQDCHKTLFRKSYEANNHRFIKPVEYVFFSGQQITVQKWVCDV